MPLARKDAKHDIKPWIFVALTGSGPLLGSEMNTFFDNFLKGIMSKTLANYKQ